MTKSGLKKVVDDNTQVLILGSLPSDISIAKQEYYANNSNDFWKILGDIFNENFKDLDYDEKIVLLRSKHVGLWDVYHSAKRPGSMDFEISEPALNNFKLLKHKFPNLRLVCFNGKEAGKSEKILRELGFETVVFPSSSGANRRDQKGRLNAWSKISNCIH